MTANYLGFDTTVRDKVQGILHLTLASAVLTHKSIIVNSSTYK